MYENITSKFSSFFHPYLDCQADAEFSIYISFTA